MNLTLGHAGSRAIRIDLDAMLRTRLLVQGNSGAGKSWLLRRLAEQLFGKVPVLILDPEGEFATLREQYGYVLVGKGGETPADTRSAALVAHKLLELRASAVCDLYEVKAAERHRWVRLFLEALVDAPKKLWHPTVVIVDEAHLFCPEKGTGESDALDAMIDLATRGRKRGLCAVFATQRLGKLRKDAAAELLNVLIGSTFIDVDRERAADALGIARSDKGKFFEEIRLLAPGQFWGLGRAVALERVLIKVGPVETSHPESGSAKHAAEPPPPPEKVRALLPKLADLPKQAEEKAKTEAELRAEIRELKALLRHEQTVVQPAGRLIEKIKEKRVEVPILKDAQVKRLEATVCRVDKMNERTLKVLGAAADLAGELLVTVRAAQATPTLGSFGADVKFPPAGEVRSAPDRFVMRTVSASGRRSAPVSVPSGLETGAQRILDTVAMLDVRGISATREAVARWMTIHPNGGRYLRTLARLREEGYLEGLRLTDRGQQAAQPLDTGTDAALAACKEESQRKALREILKAHPEALTREQLAERLGIHPNGGRYLRSLAWLRTMGLLAERGPLAAQEGCFR